MGKAGNVLARADNPTMDIPSGMAFPPMRPDQACIRTIALRVGTFLPWGSYKCGLVTAPIRGMEGFLIFLPLFSALPPSLPGLVSIQRANI